MQVSVLGVFQSGCLVKSDCADPLSTCSSQQCTCTDGYVHDISLQSCKVMVDSACSTDDDCSSNTRCINNTCTCIPGYQGYDGLCKGITYLLTRRHGTFQCVSIYFHCNNNYF